MNCPVTSALLIILLGLFSSMISCSSKAQSYTFSTIGGSPSQIGSADGNETTSRFLRPEYLCVDAAGKVYVSDTENNTIRQLTRTGTNWMTSTIAGLARTTGAVDGTNTAARFSLPRGIVVDPAGRIFVADFGNNLIRKIVQVGTNWVVTTATSVPQPWGLALDAAGNLYVTEYLNGVIRRLSPSGTNWDWSILAGSGTFGSVDGTNREAQIATPSGLAVDAAGNLYLGEYWSYTVRRIASIGTDWVVTTIAGQTRGFGWTDGTNQDALFAGPRGVAINPAGTLFIADSFSGGIRQVTPIGPDWVVTTVAGSLGAFGSADGTGSEAQFDVPYGIALDGQGNVYVADTFNSTIRFGKPFRPVLKISYSAHKIALFWPTQAFGFTLEASTTLTPNPVWMPISDGVTISGDSFVVTNDAVGGAAFYRLRKP